MNKINKSDQNLKIEPLVEKLAVQLHFDPVYPELFSEALVHSSYSHEHGIPDNERLEFLGDSVLSLITTTFLYKNYPDYREGDLAKLKSIIVSAQALAELAKQLRLDSYIKLGAGESRSNGRAKPNILADLFEAFIGAYYLNFGLEQTTALVEPLIKKNLSEFNRQFTLLNAKNELQELAQSKGLFPKYRTVKEEGPPHQRRFTVEVLINDRQIGVGEGKSLKEAQNNAALAALSKFNRDKR
ncbi:MAG: ribonuclease III [Firmicutes bacterium]|nr:ribonuclease III [Bacillota bacterium]